MRRISEGPIEPPATAAYNSPPTVGVAYRPLSGARVAVPPPPYVLPPRSQGTTEFRPASSSNIRVQTSAVPQSQRTTQQPALFYPDDLGASTDSKGGEEFSPRLPETQLAEDFESEILKLKHDDLTRRVDFLESIVLKVVHQEETLDERVRLRNAKFAVKENEHHGGDRGYDVMYHHVHDPATDAHKFPHLGQGGGGVGGIGSSANFQDHGSTGGSFSNLGSGGIFGKPLTRRPPVRKDPLLPDPEEDLMGDFSEGFAAQLMY
ncbi:unnamed protein product [Amoebophrya sp. A25]|nr:unnamed protein product [Amoebophrya sp. A25]|eukprot:GSA25T00005462001.1